MSKYKFSHSERYAVWLKHDKRCWLCLEPLRLAECSVDHVIPEQLLTSPDELAGVLEQYGLPADFSVNGFGNWLPAHQRCNQQKSGAVLEYVPGLKLTLDKLAKKASKVAASAQAVTRNIEKDKVLAKVNVAFENKRVTEDDLKELIVSLRDIADDDAAIIEEEIGIHFHFDTSRWKVVHQSTGYVVVSDGRLGGMVPTTATPDITWECPACGRYGPWNGVMCMSCGRMSDPYD